MEEHEKHLGIVFQWLRDHHLFLSKSKVDLYSKRLECLGHIIDGQGIHADADKMQRIHEWRCPRMFNDVQCFLGLVQYLAHYMPDISAYTTPLSGCERNSCPFACKAPILKPINYDNPDPIYHQWLQGRSRSHLWTRTQLEDMLTSWVHVQEIQ